MKSINKQGKINKGKNEVKVEFTAKNITPYGGMESENFSKSV